MNYGYGHIMTKTKNSDSTLWKGTDKNWAIMGYFRCVNKDMLWGYSILSTKEENI